MTSYFTQSKSQVLYNDYVGSVPPPILATSAPSTILLCPSALAALTSHCSWNMPHIFPPLHLCCSSSLYLDHSSLRYKLS